MQRLKAFLRRHNRDEGRRSGARTRKGKTTPLNTKGSLDSRHYNEHVEQPYRNRGTDRPGRADHRADHRAKRDADDHDIPPRSKYRQPLNDSFRVESSRPAGLSLEAISETRSKCEETEKVEEAETDGPLDTSPVVGTPTNKPASEAELMEVVGGKASDSEASYEEANVIHGEERMNVPALETHEAHDCETDESEEVYEDCVERHSSNGMFPSLTSAVDTDETMDYAPTVTHEIVRPHVHEIIEEQIYRSIHNHEVYHRIQPVYDVEFLPARHFVPGNDGSLVEVAEEDLPDCTGSNQKWYLGKTSSLGEIPLPLKSPIRQASRARAMAQGKVSAQDSG
ncbi:hypothetical protein GGR52DRAFT_110420 [Hypoxylon sp. FL1284]|nr:hypothetical protein GGR52DRAFT_110420 [Hypoxylon sp. FL1284]